MAPYTVKWGIMATGGIAETFTKDLLADPLYRDVRDVAHIVAAVASSSSVSSAESFISRVGADPSSTRAYGSYAELVADPDVDILYVATPHSHHFQNAMLAIEAGKNVLCEKSFTVTAAQAHKLVATAREKGLFLMEAVWTRYFPLCVQVREMVQRGEIGRLVRVFADFSFNQAADSDKLIWDDDHRMVNPDLAGGALLDLGVYSLTWVFQILYHLQPGPTRERPVVTAAMNKYHTGADENTTVILQFPQHGTMGIATTTMRAANDVDGKGTSGPAVRIQGSRGEIQIVGVPARPMQFRVVRPDSAGTAEVVDCPIPRDPQRNNWGHGMFWEADECARCLRDGKRESATLPLDESILIMEVMEEALRQGGVAYPELITTDVYDAQSPLNTGKRS